MNKETTIIKTKDHYGEHCLSDSLCNVRDNKIGPKGYVEIYERDKFGNENILGKSNLIVYNARELIAQKIVNINNNYADSSLNEFLCWFGVGDGGANSGDPFNPNPPLNRDTNLYNSIPISATDATCADYNGGFFYKAPIDDITFEQDPLNENAWLILRTITTLGMQRSVGYQINEAGLFTAASNASGYGGPFNLFARITFPTLVKTDTRELVFIWYLFT